MKTLYAFTSCALVLSCAQIFGGVERATVETATDELNPQRFELAVESGYLFGAFNPPTDYEIGAEFITARVRWGVCSATAGFAATTNSMSARSRSRSYAGLRTIISGLIWECVITLFGRAAVSFPTFQAGLVWDGLTVIQKFPVARARILRLIFYRQPEFPTWWKITGR